MCRRSHGAKVVEAHGYLTQEGPEKGRPYGVIRQKKSTTSADLKERSMGKKRLSGFFRGSLRRESGIKKGKGFLSRDCLGEEY